jgi:diguanylate cyclase (GGDEF)-like protein
MQLTKDHRLPARRPAARLRSQDLLGVAGLAAAIALVFALDRGTGLAHVQHLYYVPIIVTAIRFGTLGGATAASLAIVLYHLANPQAMTWRYEESDILQIVVFMAVGLVAAKLADDARRLHQLAMTDDLTGLHNLRSFERELKAMMRTARATTTPLSLLVVDLDRLKSLNDVHGHLVGAEAVQTVGRIIADHIPSDAVACRYGGDEFVIALPRSAVEAASLADTLRGEVLARAPVLGGIHFSEGALSISIGLASRPFDCDINRADSALDVVESEALFRAADTALYAAKNGGRNRVHSVTPSSSPTHRRQIRRAD